MLDRLSRYNESDAQESAPTFDLRDPINFLWRQWKLILAIGTLAVLLGAISLARQTPVYTAGTQVLLDPRKEKAGGQDMIMSDAVLDLAAIENQMAIIRSTVLLKRVAERERLLNDPEFGSVGASSGWSALSAIRSYFDAKEAEPATSKGGAPQLAADLSATVENLKTVVGVSRTGQAYLININFTSADPAKAARLANAVAEAYVVDKLDARFEAAKRASAWLSDRLDDLRKQLRESEEAVTRFRTENHLVQTGATSSLNQDQLAQLNGRRVAARSDTAEKKARYDLLKRIEARGGNISSLPDALNSTTITALRQQDADVSRREADLVARYGDKHPLVVNVRAERRDVQRGIGEETRRLAANVKNEYDLAVAREEAVSRTFREVTGQTDLDNTKAISLRELERTAAVNKSLFEDFLQRARVTEEQSTFEARDARIITPALAPASPSAPRRGQVLLISAFIGLMAGLGCAYAMEKLNAGFTTPRQVEAMLELPLLASISRMDARDLTVDGQMIPIPNYPIVKPLSRFSEAVRSLRSGITMTDVDDPPKVLQVTSTIPGEGKSTIAMSIAASAAQSNLKVLIIDCDLRHPSTSRFFNLENQTGLVEYLVGAADIKDVMRYHEPLKLFVLPAGGKTQNPADLLGSERLKALVNQMREKFDLIVVDTPPIGPVIDPVIVSGFTDKIVYVVRWASTARELVQRATQQLQGHKKIAGIVFNQVNDAQAQKYGKYAYSYYYGARYYKKYYSE